MLAVSFLFFRATFDRIAEININIDAGQDNVRCSHVSFDHNV